MWAGAPYLGPHPIGLALKAEGEPRDSKAFNQALCLKSGWGFLAGEASKYPKITAQIPIRLG